MRIHAVFISFVLVGCGGPSLKVESACSTSPSAPCSYSIAKPVGARHLSPHMVVYYDDIIQFYVLLSPSVQIAPFRSTRVPFSSVEIRAISSKAPMNTTFTSGYVEVNPTAKTLAIYLATEGGAFVGNGVFPIDGTPPGHNAP